MIRSKLVLALLSVALLALTIPASSLAGHNTTELSTKMKGKFVVPDDGAPKGKALLDVFLKPNQKKLCFNFEANRLDTLTGGTIAKAPEGNAARTKVTFFKSQGVSGDGSYEGCVKNVHGNLLKRMAKSPEKFYAQITSKAYPQGAVRGQLALSDGF